MAARMLVNDNGAFWASYSKGPRHGVAKAYRREPVSSSKPLIRMPSFLPGLTWHRYLFLFFVAVIVMHPGVCRAQEATGRPWSGSGFVESQATNGGMSFYQSANTNLSGFPAGDQARQREPGGDWPAAVPSNTPGFAFAGRQELTSPGREHPRTSATTPADGPVSDPVSPPQAGASSRASETSIPLRHPDAKGTSQTSQAKSPTAFGSATAPWMTTMSALAIVLGVLFLFYWGMKRLGPKTNQILPAEAVELLGSTALSPRQRLCLIRVGRKLVLVAMSSEGVEPLTEIDDPVEVDRLVGICASQRNGSATQVFRQVFSQYIDNAPRTG